MKSGQSEEEISGIKSLQLVFLNIRRCSHIKLSFKMYNILERKISLLKISPDFTKKSRAAGCCSKFFRPWIQPILKQGSSQSPFSCQR